MTPAERAVIAAAKELYEDYRADRTGDRFPMALMDAVEVLDAERTAAEDTRPWSLVVAEDEIFSTKTQKWYRVASTWALDLVDGVPPKVRVRCDGMAKPFIVPADARVRVRRSEMGQAVDVWAGLEVISS